MKSSVMTKLVAKLKLVMQRLRMLIMFDVYHRSSCKGETPERRRKEKRVGISI